MWESALDMFGWWWEGVWGVCGGTYGLWREADCADLWRERGANGRVAAPANELQPDHGVGIANTARHGHIDPGSAGRVWKEAVLKPLGNALRC